MTEKMKSIFDGAKYLYAEQLKGKPHVLTITACRPTELVDNKGQKSQGFEMTFKETPKAFAFAAIGIRRMLAMVLGENPDEYTGKQIELYPEPSRKSPTGWAIRVRAPSRVRSANGAAVVTGEQASEQPDDVPK